MPRGGFCVEAGEGATAVRSRGGALSSRTQPRRSPVLPTQCRGLFSFHRAAGRAKQGRAPPCCTGLRRSTFRQTNLLLARAARGPGSFARGGRVPVRRRTRRFGHFALKPGKVFAPRRTTRRQCRGWLGWHRAAGRGRNGGAAPPSTRARPGSTGAPPFVCIRSDAACEGACPRAGAKMAASLSEAQTAPPPAFMKNLSKS